MQFSEQTQSQTQNLNGLRPKQKPKSARNLRGQFCRGSTVSGTLTFFRARFRADLFLFRARFRADLLLFRARFWARFRARFRAQVRARSVWFRAQSLLVVSNASFSRHVPGPNRTYHAPSPLVPLSRSWTRTHVPYPPPSLIIHMWGSIVDVEPPIVCEICSLHGEIVRCKGDPPF